MRKLPLFFCAACVALALLPIVFTVQPGVLDRVSKPPAIDSAKLREHVRQLSVNFFPRSYDHPVQLAAAAQYVRDAMASAGATVVPQEVVVRGETFHNWVARFGPAEGAVLVIGAHYDSHGGHRQASGLPAVTSHHHTPGADDNASGVAGLIELARLFSVHPPTRPVELVAYTLEEPPQFATKHMGSAWHARSLSNDRRPVELMLSLEMIGYFTDEANSQDYPVIGMNLLYPTTGNFIALVSRPEDWKQTRALKGAMRGATDLPVRSINTFPSVPGVDFSDHRNYWSQNMAAIMVTDTAFLRNKEYHRPGDTFERLDYDRMAKVVQGIFAFAMEPP